MDQDSVSLLTTANLAALVSETMPFGKYQGYLLADLPEEYLLWFAKKEFPKGRLGEWLQLALMLHIDGSTDVLLPLKEAALKTKSQTSRQSRTAKRIIFNDE